MSDAPDTRGDKRPPALPLPFGYTWTYVKKIGEGGEGTAHLWAHLDGNQKVVRRVVIRNTDIRASQRFKTGPHKGEWIEMYIQQRLVPSGSTEAYLVPVLAAAKIPNTANGWRTYMDYFSKRDFFKVIKEHTDHRPLPEPFLWFVFLRMAKALVALDTAFREPGKNEPVVIHNDIKPGNILMGHPGSLGRDADYISYPPAYLGDFGMAYITSGDITWVSRLGKGTKGYFAPEAKLPKTEVHDVTELIRPTSRSNVYQVGMTMLTAMMGPRCPRYRDDLGLVYTQDDAWDDMVEAGQWAGYSQDLINLVENCVQFKMTDRPSPERLLAAIEILIPAHADGMDRWGTLSWIQKMSSDIDESLAADDDSHIDDDAQLNDDAQIDNDTGTGATTGQKRKASEPPESAPNAKRIKAQAALERRQMYVAALMKGVMPRPHAHKDDRPLRSRWVNRLVYNDTDEMFSPNSFFDTADPGPIEYFELEDDDENRLGVTMVDYSDDEMP